MHLESLLQVATMLLAAGSASSPTMRTSHLAKEFPKQFDDRNAIVERVTVEYLNIFKLEADGRPRIDQAPVNLVTLNDGDAFCRLLGLTFGPPQKDKPRMGWCRYEGRDAQYHYLQCIKYPDEIYRVRRTLVDDEKLIRALVTWDNESRDWDDVALPIFAAASMYLMQADLDRCLIPVAPEDLEGELAIGFLLGPFDGP